MMRRVIVNIVISRAVEYPLYMTPDDIKQRELDKLNNIYSKTDTSISAGIVELPTAGTVHPTGV